MFAELKGGGGNDFDLSKLQKLLKVPEKKTFRTIVMRFLADKHDGDRQPIVAVQGQLHHSFGGHSTASQLDKKLLRKKPRRAQGERGQCSSREGRYIGLVRDKT